MSRFLGINYIHLLVVEGLMDEPMMKEPMAELTERRARVDKETKKTERKPKAKPGSTN